MDQKEVKLSFDGEKLEALVFYLKKENTTVQKKMDEALREYLDAKSAPARPKRPARLSQPKATAPKSPAAPTGGTS